jgi:hypothetical protein
MVAVWRVVWRDTRATDAGGTESDGVSELSPAPSGERIEAFVPATSAISAPAVRIAVLLFLSAMCMPRIAGMKRQAAFGQDVLLSRRRNEVLLSGRINGTAYDGWHAPAMLTSSSAYVVSILTHCAACWCYSSATLVSLTFAQILRDVPSHGTGGALPLAPLR